MPKTKSKVIFKPVLIQRSNRQKIITKTPSSQNNIAISHGMSTNDSNKEVEQNSVEEK